MDSLTIIGILLSVLIALVAYIGKRHFQQQDAFQADTKADIRRIKDEGKEEIKTIHDQTMGEMKDIKHNYLGRFDGVTQKIDNVTDKLDDVKTEVVASERRVIDKIIDYIKTGKGPNRER